MRLRRTTTNLVRLCVVFITSALVSCASAISFYQIGNSFTSDSRPAGIAAMLETASGLPVEYGYHIRGSQTLQSLWNNPTASGTDTNAFGNHAVALPNNDWDFLTLQTFPDFSSVTLGQEVARIADFVGAADQGGAGGTTIVIYGPWAGREESKWENWYAPLENRPDTLAISAATYHDLLFDEVEALFPGRVRLASAGKVHREVRDQIIAKEVGIASTNLLYRDPIHMSGIGSFIASTTLFTTMSRTNPVGLAVPRGLGGWSQTTISDALARDIQQIVWDVLVDDKRSGLSPIGDFNIDTNVDVLDYELWRESYGARTAISTDINGDDIVDELDEQLLLNAMDPGQADLNGNGVTTLDDLTGWADQYGAVGVNAADANGDSVVDAADYTVWRDRMATAQRADFDRDGRVTQTDHALLRAQLGWAAHLPADVNGNGVVDSADYTIWRDAFTAATSLAVPEPSAALLAAIVSASFFTRRPFVRRVDAA